MDFSICAHKVGFHKFSHICMYIRTIKLVPYDITKHRATFVHTLHLVCIIKVSLSDPHT